MPAEQGNDADPFAAERFAAALEQGRSLGFVDAELRRDLKITEMLRSRGEAYSPHPDAKARAKQRLMAALAAEQDGVAGTPRRAPATPAATATATATAGRGSTADAAVTMQLPAVTAVEGRTLSGAHRGETGPDALTAIDDETADDRTAGDRTAGAPHRAGGRRHRAGRHTVASGPAGRARRTTRSAGRRGMLVGAATVLVLVALTGSGILASQDALPGDGLYAIKRASESAGLAMTFGDGAKARRHLQLASARIDEVERLVEDRESTDPELYRSTIHEFDSSAGEGSRMLLAAEPAAIGELQTWAADEAARLSALRSALPVPAMAGADDSIELLDRLLDRTGSPAAGSSCSAIAAGVDQAGCLPAPGGVPGPERGGAGGGVDSLEGVAPGPDGSTAIAPATTTPTVPGSGQLPTSPNAGSPAQPGDEGGPLPGVTSGLDELPGQVGLGGTPTGTPTPTPSGGGDDVTVPLPVVPPIISVPPLLPGAPGIGLG